MDEKALARARAYREKNREKVRASSRAYRAKNRSRLNEIARLWANRPDVKARRLARLRTPEERVKAAANTRAWRERNIERIEKARRAKTQELRKTALALYGGKCACCGEVEPMFLSFDHIEGRGKQDRIRRGCRESGPNWYRHLIKNRPDHIQILCHNCNLAKGFYGHCPHQRKKEV